MPVRTNIGARLHGVEKALHRVVELRVKVVVEPAPRAERRFVVQLC